MDLPSHITPVTSHNFRDRDRMERECEIIRLPAASDHLWGRERFFARKSRAQAYGRLLLAYSLDAAGRIIRAWYLNALDQDPNSVYRLRNDCPSEAAWLQTLAVGCDSEPAIIHLRSQSTPS